MGNSISALQTIATLLSSKVDEVSIKGTTAATFIFASHHGRSVEISESEQGWWIEFWQKTDEDFPAPAHESTVQTDAEAVRQSIDWLNSNKAQ